MAGSYVGNGADNRDITAPGSRPGYVIIKSNGNDAAVHRPGSLFNDSTLLFTTSSNLSNVIQALQSDGFQVGSDARANRSGTTYFWMAFGPELVVDPGPSILRITSVNGGANPTAGAGFPVTVQASSNVAAATDVALTLQLGTGTLGGTLTGTIPAGQSQVTISGVNYTKAESGVLLTASGTSGDYLLPGGSDPFTVDPGAIYSYTVTLSSPQAAGTSFGVTVTAKDQFANTVTNDNTTVVTLNSSTSHVQFDSNGDGVFGDNSKILNAGTFTINARDTVPETATISSTDPNGKAGSAPVTINVGTPSTLVFTLQPGSATAGAAIPGPPSVAVQDSFGNTVTDSTASITISIGTNPSGGILSGTTTKYAVAGVAGFSDLSINNAGNGYTLVASASGLTGATTQGFNIYPVVPPPSITGLSPTSGAVGASITITGSNFGAGQGNGIVAFNGTSATPANWSATSIEVPVPAGASTGNVVVNTSGGASNGVSFTVAPAPAITLLSPVSGAVGATVTITGTGFGAAQGASTVTLNGTLASPSSWSDNQIVVTVPNGATTGNLVVHASGVDSNGASFTVVAPTVITSLSPSSGVAGTQVTITGSNFGSTQGSSTVSFNGATVTPTIWSDTQLVALVPSAATTGDVVVTVGGVASNGLNFTVIPNPVISSVSPNSGAPGAQVTIAGSGFGATQGSGGVLLGTAPGDVVSWSDGQVVATVESGSNSGSAQILQNGVWSNSLPFTISATPHITGITPNTGFPGAVVTIAGTGFGSSQGSGIAWIGGSNALVNSWSDTQVSATVAASAVSGIIKIQQNGVWSNTFTFTVPSASVTLSPNVISMVVGETRSIQALNANYQAVAGLTWTSSDTTILTLSADDPPILAAVAPGNVTVFAGDASADVTVYPDLAFPVGTVLWSIPGDGSGVIYPAVPSFSGVADVFVTKDDGTVLAITTDGEVAWTTNVGNDWANSFLPDFQGGLVVYNPSTIYKLDGLTGQAYPPYQPSLSVTNIGTPAIHTDGTIFTLDYTCTDDDCLNSAGWLVGIDPSTGTSKFRAPTVNSRFQGTSTSNNYDRFGNPFCGSGSQTFSYSPTLKSPLILGDGYAYTTYVTYDSSNTTTEAVQPLPIAAYDYFDLLRQHTSDSQFNAALSDLDALLQLTGTTVNYGDLRWALENGDRATAIAYENAVVSKFLHLCDVSNTTAIKLHIFRVGSDGSSSDIVVREWNYTDSKVYAPTQDDLYDFTRVQSAPAVQVFDQRPMLTNADTGSVGSWKVDYIHYCPQETHAGCVSHVDADTEYHLTTTAGSSVASDVIWDAPGPGPVQLPVQPVLQLEDGSFVGSSFSQGVDSMVAFDSSGNVRWSVPDYFPLTATADGGLIGALAYSFDWSTGTFTAATFDANGVATGQFASLPTYSWTQQWYASTAGTTIAQIALPIIEWGTSYQAMAGGNPSSNGTSVGVFEAVEGGPVFGLRSRGSSCKLPESGVGTKVLLSGDALQQYTDTKQLLLGGGYLTCSSCSEFFNSNSTRAGYFSQLTDAVTRQVPYDGPRSTISMYDAGFMTAADAANDPIMLSVLQNAPVCANFVPSHFLYRVFAIPNGIKIAVAQIKPPASGQAKNVYINTDPEALKYLTQGTILHEALHNLTGLNDHETGEQPLDLKSFVGIRSVSGPTHDITKQLEDKGCVAKP